MNKKSQFLILTLLLFMAVTESLCASDGRIEIDWLPSYKTSFSSVYELQVDLEKLDKKAAVKYKLTDKNTSLHGLLSDGTEVEIQFSAKKKLDKYNQIKTVYRFFVPQGLENLYLGFGSKESAKLKEQEAAWNILSKAFSKSADWKSNNKHIKPVISAGGIIAVTANKEALEQFRGDRVVFSRKFKLPKNAHGAEAFASFDLKLLESNGNVPLMIQLKQYDKDGKELPACVVDLRWLTICLAEGQSVKFRESGIIDPRADKIKLIFSIRYRKSRWWSKSQALKNAESNSVVDQFKLQISKIGLRFGTRIPFPGINRKNYAKGMTGKKNDYSLALNKETFLIYDANPRATWSEAIIQREPEAYHWPTGSGTFELWFCPQWQRDKECKKAVFVQANSGTSGSKNTFECYYDPESKIYHVVLKTDTGKIKGKSVPQQELSSSKWNHLAACWDIDKGNIKLFLNGKIIIDEKFKPFKAIDVKTAKRPDMLMPSQIWIGADRLIQYNQPKYLNAYVDEVRVSDGIRYSAPFVPTQDKFKIDKNTRALFQFDLCKNGIHSGDDEFIMSSLRSKSAPSLDYITVRGKKGKKKKLTWYSKTLPDQIDPNKVMPVISYFQEEAEKNYNNAYLSKSKILKLSNGDNPVLTCPGDVYMDSVTISCPSDGTALKNPFLRKEDEVDSRNLSSIVKTLKKDSTEDEQKRANKLFSHLVAVTDYYWHDTLEFPYEGPASHCAYDPQKLLTSYLQFGCGQLNTTAMNLFLTGGFGANITHGTAHMFEQVFYNNSWHLYDLSPRIFFPARDNTRAASLAEIEEDPYLVAHPKEGNTFSHWIPSVKRSNNFSHRIVDFHDTDLTLYPGESLTYSWWNTGNFNNKIYDNGRGVSGGNISVLKKIEKYNKMPVCLTNNFPPHTANAVITFKGKPAKSNPLFSGINKNGFIYKMRSPYVIINASFGIDAKFTANEAKITASLSLDRGKTWKEVKKLTKKDCEFKLGYLPTGHHECLVKFTCDGAEISNLESSVICQINPRILTPVLKKGRNRLLFTADSGKADITIKYREKESELSLVGGVAFGIIPGYERQLFVCKTGKNFSIVIKGSRSKPSLNLPKGLKVSISKMATVPRGDTVGWLAKISVPENFKDDLYEGIVRDGKAFKKFQMLLSDDVVYGLADTAQLSKGVTLGDAGKIHLKQGRELVFSQEYPKSGEYLFYAFLKSNSKDKRVRYSITDANGKYHRSSNTHRRFYHQPGHTWMWRPLSKNTEAIVKIEAKEGDRIKLKADRGNIDLRAVLAISCNNKILLEKMRHYLESYNYSPFIFNNKWMPVMDVIQE